MANQIPLDFTASAEGVCQCGATVIFGYSGDTPCVLHSLPMCKDYESREPEDYLWWLNEVQGRHGARA